MSAQKPPNSLYVLELFYTDTLVSMRRPGVGFPRDVAIPALLHREIHCTENYTELFAHLRLACLLLHIRTLTPNQRTHDPGKFLKYTRLGGLHHIHHGPPLHLWDRSEFSHGCRAVLASFRILFPIGKTSKQNPPQPKTHRHKTPSEPRTTSKDRRDLPAEEILSTRNTELN